MRMTFAVTAIGAFIVFLAVVMAVVFIPGLVWNPPETIIAHPYTPEEERGRVLFYSNGCNYCHTQYVRYYDTGLGPISQGGNYIYDNPMILGSERTGPDLSYIGRKRDEAWEIQHWKDPRSLSPMSIMPRFDFLSDQDLKDLAAYINNLGDRVAAEWMIMPPLPYAESTNPIEYKPVKLTNQDQGWKTWTDAGLQDGKIIYITHCQTCHGDSGNGLGTYAGTKVVTPANFKAEPFKSMPDEQWFWHVSEGVQGTVMPPWKASLTEEERWKAINYIQQTFANPVERDPAEGDPTGQYANLTNPVPLTVDALEEGKAIFIRECWVCHGDAGRGNGVYRAGLRPIPPDFSDSQHYNSFTDSDYFWRISEGLPWSAMPVWKERYSEEDRWKVVHYLRVNFTQTEDRPVSQAEQVYPSGYLNAEMPTTLPIADVLADGLSNPIPVTPSWAAGRSMYLQMCAHCHGLTGIGDGWDAVGYLDVKPANFTDETVRGLSDGDWFGRVSYGIQNSAMPTWGEWMPIENRWNVIKFLQDTIVQKVPSGTAEAQNPAPIPSAYTGVVAPEYATLNKQLFIDEVGPISTTHGADLYATYCAECHAADGQGNGPGTTSHGLPGPSPFPTDMSEQYIYWRISDGVPDTFMYPFKVMFSLGDIWDLTSYMTSQGWGQSSGIPSETASRETEVSYVNR
jgi:cytochrome c oxidase cbb3-type subunit 2